MKALILSGGGALGAFEAGAIKALNDNGHEFDLICGTSIGAINAAFVAQDKVAELTALWQNIQSRNIIDYVEQVQRALAFVDRLENLTHGKILEIGAAFEDWMKIGSKKNLLALRGAVDPTPIQSILAENLNFYDLHHSLIVTATNLTYGTSESFYTFVGADAAKYQTAFEAAFTKTAHNLASLEFRDAVRASAAIPGFFEPVSMNVGTSGQKEYVDGGVANNTPVTLAAMAGATEILVVMLQPEQAPNAVYATSTLADIGMASYTVMQQQLLALDTDIVANQSHAVVQTIRPAQPLALSLLGFNDQAGINSAFQQGEATVNGTPALRK